MSKVDEARDLEEVHQPFLQTEIEEVDLYDTKGEYMCTEVREPETR